jgi:Flp pilus assembly protein TadD
MGFRFFRRLTIAPGLRLNVSRRGLGLNVGPRGSSLTVGPGGVHVNKSVSGTGISFRQRIGGPAPSVGTARAAPSSRGDQPPGIYQLVSQLQPRRTGLRWAIGLMAWGVFQSFAIPNQSPISPMTVVGLLVLGYSLVFKKAAIAYNKALKQLQAHDYRGAVENLSKTVAWKKQDHEARFLLALVLFEAIDDPAAAFPHAELLARAKPGDVKIGALLVGCRFQLGQYDQVIATLQESRDWFDLTGGEALHILLGRAFFEKGQWDVAAEVLRKLPVTSNRTDWLVLDAQYWLGYAHLKAGRKEDAKRWLTKVYAQNIEHRDVQALLKEAAPSIVTTPSTEA